MFKQILAFIVCLAIGHKYTILQVFSRETRKVGCTRCGKQWGMNDRVQVAVPWDNELEAFYRDYD